MVAESPKMGRPTERDEYKLGVVQRCLAKGMGWKWSCHFAGVDERSLRRWRKEDPVLLTALQMEHAKPVEIAMGCLTTAAATDWRAAVELMKLYPTPVEVDDDAMEDLAARLLAYNDAMRATVPEPPATNGSADHA